MMNKNPRPGPKVGICPANAHNCNLFECQLRCVMLHAAPIDELFDGPMMTHFVGFRGEEYHSAVRAFGPPDFFHRNWDMRAQREIAAHDRVIFARAKDAMSPPSPYNYDDSNQADDPAAAERKSRQTGSGS